MAHHRNTCEPGRTSPYHVDIRLRKLWQRYAQQKTLRQIACNLCVSAGTASNIAMLYETTGSLSPLKPVKSSSFSHRYAFRRKSSRSRMALHQLQLFFVKTPRSLNFEPEPHLQHENYASSVRSQHKISSFCRTLTISTSRSTSVEN